MKVRIVLRESDETLREGYGFANQREDCIAFAAKLDLEVVQEHQLVERSTVWNREKFQQIIDEAIQQRGDVPAIVFPRVDRFARNLQAAGYFLGSLRLNGLVVMFAQEGLIVDKEATAMQVLMFFIHSFKADQDARQIVRNTAGGRNKLAEIAKEVPNGMVIWCFDYLPKSTYGKMVTGKPSVNEERAAWVRKWAKWILEEGFGISEVCRRMNQALVPPPRQGRHWKGAAKEWHRSNVTDILRSRQLLGEFSWRGGIYLKDDSLRILSDERFEVLQKKLDENRDKSYYNAAKYDYPPLRKMVFHGCGQMMYGIPASGIPYYRCPKCKREWVNAQRLWSSIQGEIKDELLREERLIPAIRQQFDSKETIEHLEQEIKVKGHEIAGWEDAKDKAFRMGMEVRNYPPQRVQEQIDRAEEKIHHLQAEKAELGRRLATVKQRTLNEEGIKRFCQLVANNLDNLTKGQWEMLLRLMKLRVTVRSKKAIAVTVALPPVRDGAEIELSRS
ncbi:recombinase family protein [Chloroflexota bacterium]